MDEPFVVRKMDGKAMITCEISAMYCHPAWAAKSLPGPHSDFFLTDRQTVWLRRFWQWVTHWSLAIKSQQAKIEWIIGQMYQLAMPVLVKHLFCAVSVFFLRSSVGHCKPGNKIKIHCPSEHVLKSCYLCVHFLHWFVALAMGFVPVMV